jgi:hypothetical protein
LMTATGTTGGLAFALWAGIDGLVGRLRARHTPVVAT